MILNGILPGRGVVPSTQRSANLIVRTLRAVAGLAAACSGPAPRGLSCVCAVVAGLSGALVAVQPAAAQGQTWTRLLRSPPNSVELLILLSDGTVMCSRQGGAIGSAWYKLTPDIHGSYVNGTWTTLASMHDNRLYYSSQVVQDGRLFVAGGEYGTGSSRAEMYDPQTNIWTQLNIPTTVLDPGQSSPVTGGPQMISDAISEMTADGRILIGPVGPRAFAATILYNPVTDVWTNGPNILHGVFQNEATWVKLPDQSILTIDSFTTTSERYISSTNTWINDRTVPVELYDPMDSEIGGAMLLPNGKAIYFGGTGHTALYTPSGSTAMGTWVAGPDFPGSRGQPDAPVGMMVDGKVLCLASAVPSFPGDFPSPSSFYIYDYVANAFTQINGPTGLSDNIPSFQGCFLPLPDGNLLYSHFGTDLYICHPPGAPLAAAKPTVISVSMNPDGSFHLTGRGLNGINEGASFGDDLQMNTNYPLVRFTNTANNNVYYARTHHWSNTGVATGNQVVSVEYNLPANLPAGTYTKVVVTNGIASDPFEVGLPNDTCAGAIPIDIGTTPYSTTAANTDGPAEPNGGLGADPNINHDIWFLYHSTCSGMTTVSLCDANFDSRVAIYDNSCPTIPGTALVCDDNFCGVGSQVTFPAQFNHNYYIRIGGTGSATGSGNVVISCVGITNNDCANALPIFEGSTGFTTLNATTDGPIEPNAGFGADPQIGQDIWYVYVASCDGQATLNLCDANYDSRVAVYDGVCPAGPGTAIAANDNYCGTASRVSWSTSFHHVYTIRVGGTGSATGSGTLILACGTCYANCDASTIAPILNVNDFTCFLNKFAAADTYANCDGSTTPPTLNILDFVCFLNRFAAGC